MKKSFAVVALIVIVIASLIGIILHTYAPPVILDGPSMEPTLHSGQKLTIIKYHAVGDVKRGDIVEYNSANAEVTRMVKSGRLIHRVVALPGERIVIKDGGVLVYNTQHPDGFNPDTYLKEPSKTTGSADVKLKSNQFYILGDNRPNSLDSRAHGPVSYSDIIGKAKP